MLVHVAPEPDAASPSGWQQMLVRVVRRVLISTR